MAKYKRTVIGSVVKGKDGKGDYIKVSKDVVLKQGDFLNLESKAQQLKSVSDAEAAGKLPADVAAEIRGNIEKMPEFVRFNIVRVDKTE